MPAGNDFAAVEGGESFAVALRTNGSIVAWGNDRWGQVSGVPKGTGFVMVIAGDGHAVALRSNGALVSWGYWAIAYDDPQLGVPRDVTPPAGLWVAGERTPTAVLDAAANRNFVGFYSGSAHGVAFTPGSPFTELAGTSAFTVHFGTGQMDGTLDFRAAGRDGPLMGAAAQVTAGRQGFNGQITSIDGIAPAASVITGGFFGVADAGGGAQAPGAVGGTFAAQAAANGLQYSGAFTSGLGSAP